MKNLIFLEFKKKSIFRGVTKIYRANCLQKGPCTVSRSKGWGRAGLTTKRRLVFVCIRVLDFSFLSLSSGTKTL